MATSSTSLRSQVSQHSQVSQRSQASQRSKVSQRSPNNQSHNQINGNEIEYNGSNQLKLSPSLTSDHSSLKEADDRENSSQIQVVLQSADGSQNEGDEKINEDDKEKVEEERVVILQEDREEIPENSTQSINDNEQLINNHISKDHEDTRSDSTAPDSFSQSSVKNIDYYKGTPSSINSRGHVVWPLNCSLQLDFSINAQHGGCTSLILASSSYNRQTSAALLMLRSGFDCNHCSNTAIHKLLGKKHQSIFDIRHDMKGKLIIDTSSGANFVTLLSNNAFDTSLECGLVCTPNNDELKCDLPLKVDEFNGGAAILLCSAPCQGRVKAKLSAFGALYLLRFGIDGNNFQAEKLYGDAQWKFSTKAADSRLRVLGPQSSQYCLYHNRSDCYQQVTASDGKIWKNFIYHTQAIDGGEKTKLLKLTSPIQHCVLIVLCSHSYGKEGNTVSAVYLLTISTETVKKRRVRVAYIKGSGATSDVDTTSSSSTSSSNIWKFSLSNSCIYIRGPSGPCRYAVLSNISNKLSTSPAGMPQIDHNQHQSLATNTQSYLLSQVDINKEKISGWLSWNCTICVHVDEKEAFRIKSHELVQEGNRYTFGKLWPSQQRILGLHLVRVFALFRNNQISGVEGSEVKIELRGSPMQLSRQPNFVALAVNCSGLSYCSSDGIVYMSEDDLFLSYDQGFTGTMLKGICYNSALNQTVMNTEDGFLYRSTRISNVASDGKVVKYEFPIENGNYILRLHYLESTVQCCMLQGRNATKHVQSLMNEADGELELGNTANYINLQLSIDNGKFSMTLFEQPLCAFALLYDSKEGNTSYSNSIDQQYQMNDPEYELPITHILCKKEMFQVGWSDNLLRNYNGQLDNKMFWKMGSAWKVFYGSKGKDRALIFVTSNVYCRKFQEINLTDYFSSEVLDKAPDIQAFEWYSGGSSCNENDYYEFKVKLLRHGRKVVREYSSGKITSLSPNKWQKEVVTFRNYGSGVRIVHFESSGHNVDGKHEHQGPILAMASLRIRLRNIPRENDILQDLVMGKTKSTKIGRRRRIIRQLFLDNAGLLSDEEILNRHVKSANRRLRRDSSKYFSDYSFGTSKSAFENDLDNLPFVESIQPLNTVKEEEINGDISNGTDERNENEKENDGTTSITRSNLIVDVEDRILTETFHERRKSRSEYENVVQDIEKRHIHSHGVTVYNHRYSRWNYKCNHPDVIQAMYTLGTMYEKEMRLDEAIQCYRAAIQRQIKIKSPRQKLLLVKGLLGLGSILCTQRNLLESKRVVFRALELATDFLGSDHPYVTAILSLFGQLSYKQGCYREALTFYMEDLAVTCKRFGIVHPRTAGILNNIGLAYADLLKDSAESVYSAALSILRDFYGDTPSIHIAITRFNLACFYQSVHMHQRAEFQFKAAANLFDILLGSSHPYTEEALQAYHDSHDLV